MNKTRERKILERTIIFSITIIGFISFLIFDLAFAYSYKLDGYKDFQWLAFWTHISNTLALIWISLSLISLLTNNDKLESKIQHWNVKNTIYTFIITTGLIFVAVSYIPVVIHYVKSGPIGEIENLIKNIAMEGKIQGFEVDTSLSMLENYSNVNQWILESVDSGQKIFVMTNGNEININPNNLYRAFVIIGTTFKHVIIPGLFIYLAFTEKGYTSTQGISDWNKSMIQFIWPCIYLVYAITLSASGVFNPPYPVLDFGFTYSFYEMTSRSQYIWGIIYLLLDLVVGIVFVSTSFLQYKINSKYNKENDGN